jgi:hypothetical protein
MRESYDEIYNGPIRSSPIATDSVAIKKTGRFIAKQSTKSGKATHNHNWIYGAENAVCTKCGYTLPKLSKLPTRGFQSPTQRW